MSNYNKAYNVCLAYLGEDSTTTTAAIKDAIEKANLMVGMTLTDIELSNLYDDLMSMYTTNIDKAQILEGKDRREPWLTDFKSMSGVKWPFWLRYKEHLLQHEHYPQKAIQELDRITDIVLDKLFNPQREDVIVDKKGMVVGLVQSGKTSNYTGLICKAADAGFNLIIVLAGLHNNLRSQTQQRLDEGFLGFDTQYARVANKAAENNKVGVGLIKNPDYKCAIANSLTTSLENGDFNKDALKTMGLNFDTPQPFLMVVKKNASVLKNLLIWLNNQSKEKISNKSLLIIDDEADNASVNTKKADEDPTAINSAIRKIAAKCTRSAYVGYTATPFANIFIPLESPNSDYEDLFPKDFIINLPTPDTYIGPAKIFGVKSSEDKKDSILPVTIPIDDCLELTKKQKKQDPLPTELPKSLKIAIKSFILTCAIRRFRGQGNKHNSMLIHVSRFQNWHDGFREMVDEEFQYCKSNIKDKDPQFLEELKHLYEEDSSVQRSFISITKEILDSDLTEIKAGIQLSSWDNILPHLSVAVDKIKVKAINGTSGDVLEYKDYEKTGVSVIAIGGDKLSRGLTLEGLSISYFLRPSKMYDTLMQMGRWFGYRPGYVDLCRLYTSQQLIDWYRYIAIATEELREEFNHLAEINGTPDQFALKVRTHPGQLQVTALGKRRNSSTIEVSWAGKLLETRLLCKDKDSRDFNLSLTDNLFSSLGIYKQINKKGLEESEGPNPNCYMWSNVTSDIICDYLANFRLPDSFKKLDIDRVIEFIRKVVEEKGEMNSWNVAIVSKNQKDACFYKFSNGIEVGCCERSRDADVTYRNVYHIPKNRIKGAVSDEFVDLDQALLDKAKTETIEIKKNNGKEWKEDYPAPELVRRKYRPHSTPLLLFYPIDASSVNIEQEEIYKKNSDDIKKPIIGFCLAFPSTDGDIACKYLVNKVLSIIPEVNIDEDDLED